jgi:hypothetical protein
MGLRLWWLLVVLSGQRGGSKEEGQSSLWAMMLVYEGVNRRG